nr:MAG TPA: hypothetical protein [Caudoviricetes sp.]
MHGYDDFYVLSNYWPVYKGLTVTGVKNLMFTERD